MKDNLQGLIADSSIAELESVIAQAKKQIEERKETELNNARIQVRELAASLGVSLEDLMVEPTKVARTSKKAEVKYRNPANQEETWTGRGKQPKWLVAKLESGSTLEDFAV